MDCVIRRRSRAFAGKLVELIDSLDLERLYLAVRWERLTGPAALGCSIFGCRIEGKERGMVKTHDELLKETKDLDIPTNSGVYKPKSEAWSELQITDWELHRRINDERRHRREHRLWIVALVAAIFAGLSAIASWWPALTGVGTAQ